MFVFGHLGFGRALAQPFKKSLDVAPLLLGALLPDIIDKPLFVLFPGVFHGSRGIAHTLIFLIPIFIFARFAKSANARVLFSVAVGVTTHLVLDNVGDLLAVHQYGFTANCQTLFWPAGGFDFPAAPHLTLGEQAGRLLTPYFLISEIFGACLLIWFTFRDRQSLRPAHRE